VHRTVRAVELKDITRAIFEQAVRLYLEEAYAGARAPEAIQPRLDFPAGNTLAEMAAGEMFERTPPDVPPPQCRRIRLRLGNQAYPHMKLGADPIPDTRDWVLAVDCHDENLMKVATDREREALAVLLRQNADVKSRIEKRWTDAGLPTFERYIRERLSQHRVGDARAGV